jgi:hypothetical protein
MTLTTSRLASRQRAHIRLDSNIVTSARHLYYVFTTVIRLDQNNVINILFLKRLSKILTLLDMPALVTSLPLAIYRNRSATLVAPMVCQVKVEPGVRDKEPFSRPDQCMTVEHGMTEIPVYTGVFFVWAYIPLEIIRASNSGVVVFEIFGFQTNVRAIAHVPYGEMFAHFFKVPL